MKQRLLTFVLFLFGLTTTASASTQAFSPEELRNLGETFQMRGVDQFISSRASNTVSVELQKWLVPWTTECFETLIPKTAGSGTLTPTEVALALQKDPTLKGKVKAALSQKIQEWLPKVAKHVLQKEVWQDQIKANTDDPYLKNVEEALEHAFGDTANENLDRIIGPMYERLINQFIPGDAWDRAQKFSRLDDVIRNTLNDNNVYQLVDRFSGLIGAGTIKGLKQNILNGLKDGLPDDFVEALANGPDALESYAEKYRQYLPTEQLARLKNKIESIPLFDIPNQLYAGILAAQTAKHLSKGMSTCPAACNWHEINRSREVLMTMMAQLKNKEKVSVNLGSFLGMLKVLENKLGKINWKHMDKIKKWGPGNQYYKQMAKLEAKFKKVDDFLEKGKDKAFNKYRSLLDEFVGDMNDLSDKMLDPLRDLADKVNIPDLEDLRKYENMKKLAGFEDGILGEKGNESLWDKAKKSKVGGWLDKANKKASDWLGGAAANIAEKLKALEWVGDLLDVEKVPAEKRSETSDFDPVFLHNGEFYMKVTDVTIPLGETPFQFTRSYRSAGLFMSPLGYQWHHNFEAGLKFYTGSKGVGFIYLDEEGLKFFFQQTEKDSFESPKNYPATLKMTSEGYLMEYKSGRKLHFDRAGKLRKIIGEKGGVLQVSYDTDKRISQVSYSEKESVVFHYRSDGLLEKLEDITGRVWQYDYDREGHLIGSTTPGTPAFPKGKTTRYRYDDQHRMILVMDPKGQVYLENHYGENGEAAGKVAFQHFGNNTYSIEARYDGNITWVKDRRGVLHRYHHNEEGELVKHELEMKNGEWKEFSQIADLEPSAPTSAPKSLRLEKKPPEEKSSALGPKLVAEEKNEDLNQYQFDRWGNIVEVRSPNGDLRQLKVDAGNLITEEAFNKEVRRYFYDANDNIIRTEVPSRNLVLEYQYDILDRLIAKSEIFDDQKITTRYGYDPQGRLSQYVFPLGNNIHFYYDELGDLTKEVWAEDSHLERVITFTPEEESPSILTAQNETLVRAYPKEPTMTFDPVGRPTKVNDTKYEWDANGRLVSLSDPEMGESHFAYDALNRLIWEMHPDKTQRSFAYDDQNRLSAFVDKSGLLHRLEYDAAGNVIARSAGSERLEYVFDQEGRLVEARNKDIVVQRRYDEDGRMTGESLNGRWTTFTYNEQGEKTGIRTPSGFQTVREYGATGNLRQVFAGAMLVVKIGANETVWGNGVTLKEDFGEKGPTKQAYQFSGEPKSRGWEYVYGDDHRLNIAKSIFDNKTEEYSYDSSGALTSEPVTEPSPIHDRLGNVTFWKDQKYRYDVWNRLVAIDDAKGNPLVRYTYDPFGRVVRREAGSEKIDYVYDEWNRIESINDKQQTRQWIYSDNLDQLLAMIYQGHTYYGHADRLGSLRYISNEAGQLIENFDYSSFGKRETRLDDPDFESEVGYLGRPFEVHSGLVNLRYRFYAPALKRFISEDPFGFKNDFFRASNVRTPLNLAYHMGQGGGSRNTYANYVEKDGKKYLLNLDLFSQHSLPAPQIPELDLYAYANNDPINFYDPLGLYSIDIVLPPWSARSDNRYRAGNLVISDVQGNKRGGPYKALGRSSSKIKKKKITFTNPNTTRDPLKQYGDTPTGGYTAHVEDHRGNPAWETKSYGTNPIIRMLPVSGDAWKAAENGASGKDRSGILIHGGDRAADPVQSQKDYGHDLKPTYGCVRLSNEDLAELIATVNLLDQEEKALHRESEDDRITVKEDENLLRRKKEEKALNGKSKAGNITVKEGKNLLRRKK